MAAERQKLTHEFIARNTLYFRPETEMEAIEIQKNLFALGFGWISTGVSVWEPVTCVKIGIGVEGGKMVSSWPNGAQLVHLTDFESFDVRRLLSPQQEYLLEQFNVLSAKVDHLTALMEKVVAVIEPKPLDKPLPSVLGPKKP